MGYKDWKQHRLLEARRVSNRRRGSSFGTAARTVIYGSPKAGEAPPEHGFLGAIGAGAGVAAGTIIGTRMAKSASTGTPLITKAGRQAWSKRWQTLKKFPGKHPYATAVLGGIGLAAAGVTGYKRWKDSQKVINKNKIRQRPRRGRR